MGRENRLQTVREAERMREIIPEDFRATVSAPAANRPPIFADQPKKTQPRQAQGVVNTRKRKPVTDPIEAETIERVFEGGTAVLFATGPGLTSEVIETVMAAIDGGQNVYLFGCNDSYRIAPYLNVHYACDFAWWNIHYLDAAQHKTTNGMWTQEPGMSKEKFPLLRRIAGSGSPGLSDKQNLIHFGNNSGFQLINLAHLFGIKNMILCGYNMQVINSKKHFFGDHPEGLNRGGGYTGFVQNYEKIKPEKHGIEIINATPQTALHCFPKMDLHDALQKFR